MVLLQNILIQVNFSILKSRTSHISLADSLDLSDSMDLAQVVEVHPNVVQDVNQLRRCITIHDFVKVANIYENYCDVPFLLLCNVSDALLDSVFDEPGEQRTQYVFALTVALVQLLPKNIVFPF